MRKLITIEMKKRTTGAQHSNSVSNMLKKIAFIVVAMTMLSTVTWAQNPGPFYRQFNFNPYLFNPAYVGINNQIEANVSYRQQWTNFKDAPVTAGASLQLPESDRVALGFNIMTDKQVMLQHSNFMATFGYVLPIARNQSIRFGLSAGVGLNKLDLNANEMNTNDPVITRATGTNYYVDGNFGAVYTYEGLRVGFALTDFFKSDPFNPETFNQFKMSNLRNRLFSASYKFNVGKMQQFALEPYALYRQTSDGVQDYFEVATVAYFKDNIWTGVSYNQNHGLGLIFGMNVKEKFRFGYSYDFAGMGSKMASGGAHELHLGIRLASKKVSARGKNGAKPAGRVLANAPTKTPSSDSYKSVLEQPSVIEDPADNEVHQQRLAAEDPAVKPADVKANEPTVATPNASTPVSAPSNEVATTNAPAKSAPKAAPAPKVKENFTMSSGRHYVVIGVFKNLSGSMEFVRATRARGYSANATLNPKNNFYYVFIYSGTDVSEARKKRNEYKLKNLFKEAWLFSME